MKPTHFRPHVERNPLSFSDDPFDSWRLRTRRAGESRSPRAVGNLSAKRSASQDSTNGPTILGLSAESLEGVEVRFGDCRPETVLDWQRRRFRRFWSQLSRHTNPGRPRTNADIRKLVKTMAEANWAGAHNEFMGNCSSWESRFPNVRFPDSCRDGARRRTI